MAEARAAYRTLLRAVDRNITSVSGSRQWREFVVSEFRRWQQGEGDAAQAAATLQRAKDWAFLITSVHEHKELLLSYNIGIPVADREKDMNRKAANRVGLRMPDDPHASGRVPIPAEQQAPK